jgi:catechol 2,3-dioxygenase-like lactoylglutathione lyase family enzyme
VSRGAASEIQSLDYITISVSNVATSAIFYKETFGFDILHQSQHFALISLPNINLGLHSGKDGGPANTNLHFRVADLDKAYERLQGRGIAFIEQPKLQAWGIRSASLLDPDGYRLELIEGTSTPK